MKTIPFALVNDGSSDTGISKMNLAYVLIFYINNSDTVSFKFFDMCPTTGEDGCKSETFFNAIDSALGHDGISWDKCVNMEVDNTNSNTGEHNSLKSRILAKNPCCFIPGCSCHLAHLAAGKEGKAYTLTSGFDVEEHQVDFYYYFKNSSRRKAILAEYMDFNDLDWNNIVRYVKTRWLSLQLCCEKELKSIQLWFLSLRVIQKTVTERTIGMSTLITKEKQLTDFHGLKKLMTIH